MRILITSPAPETAELVSSLAARGHQVTVIPLITPERIEAPDVKLEGAQAFIVTSTEAVRALADTVSIRFFPLFADSAEVAKAAKAEGFTKVEASSGDASDFAKLIVTTLQPDEGALVHACHDKETTTITGTLINMGFAVRPLKLYTLKRSQTLPPALVSDLKAGVFDGAVILSVDEARALTTLLQRADLEHLVKDWVVYATTTLASAPMRALNVKQTVVAASPDLDALLAKLDEADRALLTEPEPEPETKEQQEKPQPKHEYDSKPELETRPEPDIKPLPKRENPATISSNKKEPSDSMAHSKDETKLSAQETERNVQDQPTPDAQKEDRAKLDPLKTGRTAQLMAEDAADLRSQTNRTQSQRKSKKKADDNVDPIPDAPIPSTTETGAKPPAQPSKPSSSFGRFITIVVVLIVVVAGLFGTMPWWYGRMPMLVQGWVPEQIRPPSAQVSVSVTQDITALQQRLAATETEIAALKRTVQSTPTTAPLGTSATDAVVVDLQQRLKNIEAQATNAPIEAVGANVESTTALSNAVTNQAQQLATVTARIATVEAALGNAAALEDVSTRVATLEDRSADAATVLALAARITQVEAAASTLVNEQSSAVGLLLAMSQLQDAVSDGRAYALELETVNAFAAKATRLTFETAALTEHQKNGVATRTDLKDRFDRIAPAVVRAGLLPTNSASWIQRALDQILSLVNVRRLEDDGSATVGAIITRMQRALDDGNLSAAVSSAEALSGLSGDTLAPWLKDAQARVAVETAVSDLTTKAIAHMNSGREITIIPAQTEN